MRTVETVTHRYVLPVATLLLTNMTYELWVGLESRVEINVLEWDDLIPADDMTPDELAHVKAWIAV